MAVTLDENVLMFVFGAILIPFIGFMLKLLVDFRVVKTQMEDQNNTLKEVKIEIDNINRLWQEVAILKVHVNNLQRDISGGKGAPVNQ